MLGYNQQENDRRSAKHKYPPLKHDNGCLLPHCPSSDSNTSGGFRNEVNCGRKTRLTVPVGPLRCFAIMTSAVPRLASVGFTISSRYKSATKSASCSICPLSRRSERRGRPPRVSGARL